MEIEPAENGGHTVTHHYKESPRKDNRAAAGISMGYAEPESHVFGKNEGHEMLAHVANHLNIPESQGEPAQETEEPEGEEEA
jgi:hypothetical protein